MASSSNAVATDESRPSPRERRRERLRRDLTDAALRLFAERGFNNVSVEEIADAADVSRSTFFRYFGSKEDVAIGKDADRIAEVRDLIDRLRPETRTLDAANEVAMYVARRVQESREQVMAVDRMLQDAPQLSARSAESSRVWQGLVTEMAAHKLATPPDDIIPPLVGATTIGAVNAGIYAWRGGGYEADLPSLVQTAFTLLVGGIEQHPTLTAEAL